MIEREGPDTTAGGDARPDGAAPRPTDQGDPGLLKRWIEFVSGLPWPPVIAAAVFAGVGLWLVSGTDLAAAQRSDALGLVNLLRDDSGELHILQLRVAALVDMGFACGYLVLTSWIIAHLRKLNTRSGRVRGRQNARAEVGVAAVAGAAMADFVENGLLLAQLGRLDATALEQLPTAGDTPSSEPLEAAGVDGFGDSLLDAMQLAGLVKWALLTVTLLVVLDMWLRKVRSATGFTAHDSRERPPSGTVAEWDPPTDTVRRGVCLSGGGIRSASFSLGSLQALQEHDELDDLDYLAAVSGGGYMAAGWAVSNDLSGRPAPSDPDAWSPGSTEEHWFRAHSSYLVPDVWQGTQGVARLLAGIVVNLVLVWAVLFVAARPVGWLIHEVHPEMRPAKPLTLPNDLESGFRLDTIIEIDPVVRTDDGTAVEVRRFRVNIDRAEEGQDGVTGDADNEVCFDVAPFTDDPTSSCYLIYQQEPGLLELSQGVLSVVRDPEVKARISTCDKDLEETGEKLDAEALERCRNVKRLLTVAAQPDLKTDDRPVGQIEQIDTARPLGEVGVIADRLSLDSARISRTEGPATRGERETDAWMWLGLAGLLGAGILLALGPMLGRSTDERARRLRYGSVMLMVAGTAWFVVLIALPWLLDELPDRVSSLTEEGNDLTDRVRRELLVPAGGFMALAFAAVSQYLNGNRAAAGREKKSKSWWRRAHKQVEGASEQLKWYELSPSKILAAIAMVVVPLFIVIGQLQYAVANGPGGKLVSVARLQLVLPEWLLIDWVRWALLVVGLIALSMLADAHSWSLHPFYKRRLQTAYLLERDPETGRAGDLSYDRPIAFTPVPSAWPGLHRQSPSDDGPDGDDGDEHEASRLQLILCCAANLSEVARVPPGRRAASFTFSSDVIGGPVVGWASAQEYWDRLSEARRRDITVPSAMSISGAAFSPAMGKQNLGPVGAALAMANLRLGVWLPHPQMVNDLVEEDTTRSRFAWARKRPGWPWFFKEVRNSYPFQSPYLYVSDGGHWDNLGLVELLRRGCTEIICVNAGGDGQAEFGTIAEAIALAREELGVEIDIDPSALRPPLQAGSAEQGARELRRKSAPGEATPFAQKPYVDGRFTYPAVGSADPVEGKLCLIEPALTDDLPFDVHGFAESEPIFPDDSTADQVYNHRQFESFRRLGYHQAEAAIGKRPTDDPDDAPGRSDTDTGPPTDTAGAQPPGG